MAAAEPDPGQSPFSWLIEEDSGGASPSSGSRWSQLGPLDNQRLEHAVLADQGNLVAVECGRYDVDLRRRVLKAVYWDEPERRMLRSSWFYGGRANERIPYEEDDAEELEAAFQRLRVGKERAPLLVPVNKGRHDVRFEVLQPSVAEENALGTFSFILGASSSSQSRHSVAPPNEMASSVVGSDSDGQIQWTASQEPADRTNVTPSVPVWRGYESIPGVPVNENDEEHLPENVECLVFVVHGIGQYHRSHHTNMSRFFKDVEKLRTTSARHLRQQIRDGRHVPGRIEFLPLEWFESIHVDVGIGNRLRHVTLPSVAALRDFANFAIADIMVYQDLEWRDRIHKELHKKMEQTYAKFSARTPNYSGQTAIIGHSLGSVIMFDLMQKLLPASSGGLLAEASTVTSASDNITAEAASTATDEPVLEGGSLDSTSADKTADKIPPELGAKRDVVGQPTRCCPPPRCFFAIGSPLGMFLSIRLSQRGQSASRYFRGLDVRWPASSVRHGWRFFNIFHPDDPIAYRVEPLLNTDYANTPPRVILHQGGLRFHHQMRDWWRKSGDTVTAWGSRIIGQASAVAETTRDETESNPANVLVVHSLEDDGHASFFEDGPGAPAQSGAVDRLDYVIQENAFESMNELLSAINSHFTYWDCEDLTQFMTNQLLEALEASSPHGKCTSETSTAPQTR